MSITLRYAHGALVFGSISSYGVSSWRDPQDATVRDLFHACSLARPDTRQLDLIQNLFLAKPFFLHLNCRALDFRSVFQIGCAIDLKTTSQRCINGHDKLRNFSQPCPHEDTDPCFHAVIINGGTRDGCLSF
jgi:hypothetical protein